ncbi:hypothetical protein KJ940_10420, partial [Myxococcota bacterium]|nr:hypothetical protein [Myxococcota bacterium]
PAAPASQPAARPSKSNAFAAPQISRPKISAALLAQEPKLEGKGMIVGGWVTFGVSTFVSLYTLLFANIFEAELPYCSTVESCNDDRDTVSTLYNVSFFSAALAAGGLTMAILGHSAQSRSKRERVEWRQSNGLTAQRAPQLGPVYVEGGGWGLGLSAAF